MKRYFYTDPLAAAWMAKHFGMRFTARCVGHGQSGEYECMPDDWHFEVHDSQTGKYFVHPDSLPLLQVKVGDVLYKRMDDLAIRASRDTESISSDPRSDIS